MRGEANGEKGTRAWYLLNYFLLSRGVINFGVQLTFTIGIHLVNVRIRFLCGQQPVILYKNWLVVWLEIFLYLLLKECRNKMRQGENNNTGG